MLVLLGEEVFEGVLEEGDEVGEVGLVVEVEHLEVVDALGQQVHHLQVGGVVVEQAFELAVLKGLFVLPVHPVQTLFAPFVSQGLVYVE